MTTRHWLTALTFFVIALSLVACGAAATPDASKARSRSVIETGGIVPSDELRVAEYLNYYKQKLPPPINGNVGLDIRLGNAQIPVEGGTIYLQIGLSTKPADSTDIAPLNLAIVIDRSGSMDAPEKMPYVKQSLRIFLKSLARNDMVALVAYSDTAELLVPARQVGDGGWIDAAVQRLVPSGSTNLDAGMQLGFQEVDRHFDSRRNNRVILLTDGIANVGVINPDQIAADASVYTSRGIFLSTIGLGHDVNDALLSRLAKDGRGGYHYIDSAQEMDKVFREQSVGLMQNVASNVSVVIGPAPAVRIESVTGYDGQPPSGAFQIRMGDLGTGDAIVSLVRMNVGASPGGRWNLATVELRYHDLITTRDETITRAVVIDADRVYPYDPLRDVEVLRNVTIQRTAEGLKEIDRLYKAQRYQDAWDLAYRLEQDLRRVARLTNEDQMFKDADLMRKYEDTLARWVQYKSGRPPQAPDQPPSSTSTDTPTRGRDGIPQSVPTIEIR